MSFFENFGKAYGFIDNTAGQEGANQIQARNTQAIGGINKAFDTSVENLQPFIDEGNLARADVINTSSLPGFNARIGELANSDIFNSLFDRRNEALQNNLSAVGLSRSGTNARASAELPAELLLALEGMFFGRQSGIANRGFQTVQGVEGNRQANAANVANLISGIGQADSAGLVRDDAADTQGVQTFRQQTIEEAGVAASFFSDPNLKTDIEVDGHIGDLNIYKWKWRPELKGTIVWDTPERGFLSTDVKKKYPHLVGKFAGFDIINLHELLNELEEAA